MLKFKKLINAILSSNDNEISLSLKQQINNSTNASELVALSESKSLTDVVINNLKQSKLSSDLIQNMNKLLELSDIEQSTILLNGKKLILFPFLLNLNIFLLRESCELSRIKSTIM